MKYTRAVLLLLFGLAGCAASPPLTYLVLSPVSGSVYEMSGAPLAVGRVAMPPVTDRSFLTSGSGENLIVISNNAMWAAPLESMAQTVLARDLAARLPGHHVAMPGDHVPEKAMVVSVNVITFLPYPGHVVLAADWRVTMPAVTAPIEGRVRIAVPSGDTPQAQAQAMSQALGELADHIARQIAARP